MRTVAIRGTGVATATVAAKASMGYIDHQEAERRVEAINRDGMEQHDFRMREQRLRIAIKSTSPAFWTASIVATKREKQSSRTRLPKMKPSARHPDQTRG